MFRMAERIEPKANLLLVYLVLDVSYSMQGVESELNSGLDSLLKSMAQSDSTAAKVRLSLITFSDQANCLLHLADFRQVEKMPQVTTGGSTAYSEAFLELKRRIDRDVQDLQDQKYSVFRPAVFFLSDGQPNDGDPWRLTLADLTAESFVWHPNIIAFGIDQADPATIAALATNPSWAFQAAAGADTGKALSDFFKALTRSVMRSGQNVARDVAELVAETPDDFVRIKLDALPPQAHLS
jgi:uncharacterized protein YegL